MKKILLILLACGILSAEDLYEADVSAAEAHEMQKKGEAIIVDVRTTLEYIYTGHGEGFINIPAYEWTYVPKSIEERVKSSEYELKTDKPKGHIEVQKLYDAKEVFNKNFVSDVMKAMKLRNTDAVILVCRSGPRSKAAANLLAKEGIKAYNLEDGFMFGWKESKMPWDGY
ncbi:MAG: rhodanese-like domain-containing protein [Sulfuricurvum sp.]|jgi:rhodanese-related sulfurtransferase|uniref:rhodanese-like domain-containing protein n=1 Tax=Sulfuricurvum sp. TaxID=2025608 RepID=UPI002629A940|nr:rhodanese-like domain-containing protein [Sulfuricurvum sp.]MDD2838784.1 rhodanese-like domain-containing protein [Sulfuricurvum sp.]MDD3595504.1 rhodanese-like domain-containing protein [Sulfuricurvum sp.]